MDKEQTPRIIHIEETGSTNNYLREKLRKEKLPEGSAVIATYQTAGRGQVGNTWESERGENLLFSTLLYPSFIPANQQFIISQITALSVQETLSFYTENITIKWPNDIYWKEKKICGMLIENDLMGQYIYCSIQGIGININQEKFHSNAPNPVSLYQITGKKYDLNTIFQQFLQRFYHNYLNLLEEKTEEIRAKYMHNLFRGTGFHPFRENERRFEARIHSIEPTGHLILEEKSGQQHRYAFKEVSFEIEY